MLSKYKDTTITFFPVVLLILVLWTLYRITFSFPIWFDETIGKALFFGLPVWLYVVFTKNTAVIDSFAPKKLKSGLLLGIAVGGVFGFVFSILALLQAAKQIEAVLLFNSAAFWYEFALALFTGFWETLLFYSFIMTMVMHRFKNWSVVSQVLLTAGIFLAFHIPNSILRYQSDLVLPHLFTLLLFAMGQALLFSARKNAYALVLSHAIWGMVLLVHTSP